LCLGEMSRFGSDGGADRPERVDADAAQCGRLARNADRHADPRSSVPAPRRLISVGLGPVRGSAAVDSSLLGTQSIDPDVAWPKLRSLAAGSALASTRI
jgi:hypothetical protein